MVRQGKKATTGFIADFQKFILRGNVVDLAVAVVIGGAFGQIINSLVTDIITPAILTPALKAANVDKLSELSANGIQYGLFLASILNFLVIALTIFLLIRSFENFKKRQARREEIAEEIEIPAPTPEEKLISAIEKLTEVMEQKTN
jgi:large conductance mechanosensitive channel